MTTIAIDPMRESGLRTVDLRRDISGIATLIELCFGDNLDRTAQRAVREMHMLSRTGPLLWLLGSIPDKNSNWNKGFVFLNDGKVIGSVAAQPSDSGPHAWLIANLAVHPDFQRQGIARQLMLAALTQASRQSAQYIVLQVNDDNAEAIPLYENLGFDTMTTRTIWKRKRSPVPHLSNPCASLHLRLATHHDWQDELSLLEEFRPEGLIWTAPFRFDQIRPSHWRTLANLLTAQHEERWIALRTDQMVGWLHLLRRAGTAHQFRLVVRPECRPEVEQLLLVRALQRLGQMPGSVRLEHPTSEAAELLTQYNFHPIRTLRWMRKNLP